ncbi:MAG: D-alanyl-D-alanine carboxypeptidase [bacterium]|nr:D-alanyl-D-alanine carboxypeptidase [bacterium]
MFNKKALKFRPGLLTVGIISLLFSLPVITGPEPPSLDSPSYVLMDPDTGEVIYGRNIHDVRAPASTTKLMTALLAIEMGNPNDLVTISRNADAESGSSLGILEGEQIPLADLTDAMLVKSGNDAAVAIAEYIGGTESAFIDLMNQRATELDMSDTHFCNPNGLPNPSHVSTAFDLALLAQAALTHPEIREWVANKEVHFDHFGDRDDVTFETTNQLLEEYPLCNGIKTGYTDDAGFCLIASATYRDKTLIAVVLGCERNMQWPQAMELFDYGFTLYDPNYEAFRALADNDALF